MARLSEQTVAEVREAADLLELVRGRVQLVHRGGRWWGRCPFHDEDTPSFSLIPPENRAYYCFGCNEGGDAIDWMQKQEGAADFASAVEALAERFGVEVRYEEESPDQQRRRAAAEARRQLLDRAGGYYAHVLQRSADAAAAREYLAGRGLEGELLERYGIGWAPSSGTALLRRSSDAGFTPEQLVASGLARRGPGGARDFFHGRITFPIKDAQGRVQGFGARTLDPNERAKYVNSPESPAFRKRTLLFGIDVARVSAAKLKWLVVAEGYTDVMGLAAAGVENAVACMGTALTTEQVRLAGRYVEELRLCFDADAAGEGAAKRSLEAAADTPVRLTGVRLPPGSDPGDLAQSPEGREALLAAVRDSVPLVGYLVRARVERAGSSATDRQHAYDEIAELLRATPESIEKDETIRLAASLLHLGPHGEERLRADVRATQRHQDEPASAPSAPDPRAQRVHHLLVLGASRPDLTADALDGFPLKEIGDPSQRAALAQLSRGVAPEDWDATLNDLSLAVRAASPSEEVSVEELSEARDRVLLDVVAGRIQTAKQTGDEAGVLKALEVDRALRGRLRGES